MRTERATVVLRHRGRVLLRRWAGTPGWELPWSAVGDDPAAAASRAVESTGVEGPVTIREGAPVEIDDRTVYPFLVACESPETDDGEWVHATEIRRRETPAGSWRAYSAVAPTVESVRGDRTQGSAAVSVRALEVLRDRAGEGADWPALVEQANALLEARPSMAAVMNRINRAMAEAAGTADAVALERATRAGIDRALAADGRAAENATKRVEGTVLTLSRSGTVRGAFSAGDPDRVIVLESRPDREGIDVAEDLAEDADVTVTLDAAIAHVMADVDAVLVGADTVLADGSVVNKVGTRTAAVVAAREGVPVYAVAAVDKISPATEPVLESIDSEAITDREAVAVECPLFDRTPPDLITGLITEEGLLNATAIGERAADHERRARWKEPNPSEG
ncbi:translation initiation factor eIF-2B [Halalkalicoccus jeotgali]|uniref:Initiation factor 2B related protein n=1 Tax=Halalkalicoccus jeotgali (strain DSM 18796 / CECT 7217 / JCM 14584 / KCTC 4019 / B3) TaxID=795797 RepID=D8J7M3_HALJB|nr:translation initiation factor eIF-2B [Halalkalicoccus jeotgali]ADJ16043.1 initiation factor 2B related protein [Halalkalicoccus jeotgali B3]ELY38139.1 initiation factor 2B-like protein [Halalkalicoccus jeotgali B3]